MTPAEFKKIYTDLGLTQPQLADVLGYTGEHSRGTIHKLSCGAKSITPPVARLMIAYRDGYRPDDWPL